MPNLLLQGTFNQKREEKLMVARLPFGLTGAATDSFLVGKLPANAIIENAYVFAVTASNAATTDVVTIGTTETGTEIMSAGNAKTLGKTGTFTGATFTGTGKDVYVRFVVTGAKTAGELIAVVKYLEVDKTSGEYTRVS
jgi:hypothetical protein